MRYRAGGTTDGTSVYVYGGGNDVGGFLNDLWKWNPATGAWTQLANMPTGKQNIQGVYYNGKIYVPGGYIGSHITENAIYDIASNTWTTGAPLPAPQSGSNVAFNGKIYNFGGNPGPSATTSIYDIASNTWTTGAPMPAGTTYGRAVVSGNFAYMVGGITTVTVNTVYRYDFAANTWTTMAPLQTARTSEELMASPDGTSLYAVMGGDSTFFTGVPLAQSVEIYNIAGNSWSYGNPVVQKAAGPGGGLAGGKLMVQGGVDNTTYLNTVQVSTLAGGGGCGTPSATPTNTSTSTPTATATGSPTCTPGNVVGNGGFETGTFPPWVVDGTTDAPVISTAQAHSGTFSALAGNISGGEPLGDSSFYQQITVPAGGGTLSFWHWDFTTDSITFDWQDAYITDSSGTILTTIFHQCLGGNTWIQQNVDMTPYAGQTVRIKFLVHQDGFGDDTGMYVDDVTLGGGTCGTPSATPTNTSTATKRRPIRRHPADMSRHGKAPAGTAL